MAQVNSRVADEDKEKAEQVLKSLGLSISGYFASVIEYIADTGAVPFEIQQKPKLVNFDEVYAEAVEKFSDLYNGLVSLKKTLQPGIEDQMARCESLSHDHSLAVSYLRGNGRYVYGAPCQVEKVEIGDGHIRDYSLSREKFQALQSRLAEALCCLNFNNRALEQTDLEEMGNALSMAGSDLQTLRNFVPADRSTESRIASFVIAAVDALKAARLWTAGPYDPYTFNHWFAQLDAGCREVQACHKRVGPSKWSAQIQEVVDQIAVVRKEVDHWNQRRLEYGSKNNRDWLNYQGDHIDVADELVRTLQRTTSRAKAR